MKLSLCFALMLIATELKAESANFEPVTFTTRDGGVIHADYYPAGTQSVVLGHGAVFNKESWRELANQLAANNIGVLAIDFRGYGKSTSGDRPADRFEDMLAALQFLKQQGYKDISILGASMGGGIAGKTAAQIEKGILSHLILLSPAPIAKPEEMRANKILYIASTGEGGIASIKAQFQRAPEPKRLKLLNGNAHAQHIFKTAEKKALTDIIVQFLLEN